MLEKKIQEKVVKAFREDGWLAWKFTSQFRRAVPDFVFLKEGFVFWIEFKRTGEKPTDQQLEEHKKIRAHGGVVYVCDSIELGMKIKTEIEMYL